MCRENQCSAKHGCTDPDALNYDSAAKIDDGSCVAKVSGCRQPNACNYNKLANVPSGCVFPAECQQCSGHEAYDGSGTVAPKDGGDANKNGVCDDDEAKGCTDPAATNYDAAANVDDGSCVAKVSGCKYPDATNYDAAADTDDGSCSFSTGVSADALDPTSEADVEKFVTAAMAHGADTKNAVSRTWQNQNGCV